MEGGLKQESVRRGSEGRGGSLRLTSREGEMTDVEEWESAFAERSGLVQVKVEVELVELMVVVVVVVLVALRSLSAWPRRAQSCARACACVCACSCVRSVLVGRQGMRNQAISKT